MAHKTSWPKITGAHIKQQRVCGQHLCSLSTGRRMQMSTMGGAKKEAFLDNVTCRLFIIRMSSISGGHLSLNLGQ